MNVWDIFPHDLYPRSQPSAHCSLLFPTRARWPWTRLAQICWYRDGCVHCCQPWPGCCCLAAAPAEGLPSGPISHGSACTEERERERGREGGL